MDRVIHARWLEWSGPGLQHLALRLEPTRIRADAIAIVTDEGAQFSARFRIDCDPSWRVQRVEVELIGSERGLTLVADGAGNWRDGVGASIPDLAGAIDVDLPITPFTNTLPIRRLGLAAGQAAELDICYVTLPDLAVTNRPQRYTCLAPLRRYRYESLDSGFTREIEVDGNGLVTAYPDLFRRIL